MSATRPREGSALLLPQPRATGTWGWRKSRGTSASVAPLLGDFKLTLSRWFCWHSAVPKGCPLQCFWKGKGSCQAEGPH